MRVGEYFKIGYDIKNNSSGGIFQNRIRYKKIIRVGEFYFFEMSLKKIIWMGHKKIEWGNLKNFGRP